MATQAEQDKGMFVGLVMMFSSMAMQQLGKLVNPAIGKAEVDLRAAQESIDLLEMLQRKTAGNLDKTEARMLKDVLASLQMNYVETAAGGQGKQEPDAEPAEPGSAGADGGQGEPAGGTGGVVDGGAPKGTTEEPKFHKSYG